MRYNNFISILQNGYAKDMLAMRNNEKIRKLFCEIICVLCYSSKKNVISDVKLDKNNSFDLTCMSEKFKAPNVTYIEEILKEDDPKELIIPINELIFNLINKNIINVYYWYEWIIEYENICKKKKKKCVCENRSFAPSGNTHDIIWIIWDILFYYSDPNILDKKYNIIDDAINTNTNTNTNTNINTNTYANLKHKIIKNLFELFIIKYNNTVKKKRKYIIYYAFALLVENTNFTINIINKQEEAEAIVLKINTIYKEIKKNEESPKTEYLFNNLNKSNLEKTMEKIELLSTF
jgi:hypothetical protein